MAYAPNYMEFPYLYMGLWWIIWVLILSGMHIARLGAASRVKSWYGRRQIYRMDIEDGRKHPFTVPIRSIILASSKTGKIVQMSCHPPLAFKNSCCDSCLFHDYISPHMSYIIAPCSKIAWSPQKETTGYELMHVPKNYHYVFKIYSI